MEHFSFVSTILGQKLNVQNSKRCKLKQKRRCTWTANGIQKNRTKQSTTNLAEVNRNILKHTLHKIAIDLLAIKEL